MGQRGFAPSGLVVALVGFGLTRFTVTLAATDTTVAFLFAGLVPLVIGLGLATAGVLLAVGTYDRQFVRTVAAWCLVGTTSMAMLVVLTLLGERMLFEGMGAIREQTYLSTFLIGGAVGGALTGVYAARSRRHRRDLQRQANRLVVLNRLLRDQVVNAATAIRGHQELLERDYSAESVEVVGQKADEIVDLVEQVGHLAETDDTSVGEVDLVACVKQEVSAARARYPDAEFALDAPAPVDVRATAQLSGALEHLLVNAVEHSDREQPRVSVTVDTAPTTATVRVSDDGPGLPPDQQALLERGEIAEYDDPTTGFGLNVVRLVVERFDGTLETTIEDGTTVALTLQRTDSYRDSGSPVTADAGVSPSRAAVATGSALVAGLTMAGAMAALDGEFVAIGSLYGIENLLVALVTHEFHSVVFGLTYAGVLAAVPLSYTRDPAGRLLVAVVLGLLLWLFAAGVAMPLWLELVGVDAPLPNLTLPSLVGHTVWGTTVGLCYHAGDRLLAGTDRLGALTTGRLDI